jgi:hypothetical protein
MFDREMQAMLKSVLTAYPDRADEMVLEEFKETFSEWLSSHYMHDLSGLDGFPYRDICYGCTQFIDDLYQRKNGQVQVFRGDYTYHWRLNNDIQYATIDTISTDLIIALPFPRTGDVHANMQDILDAAHAKRIRVHIDGAWLSAAKDIQFNFDHPAVESVGISLSKGLGLGMNRIAMRFCRSKPNGPISIMNDFNMVGHALPMIGTAFMKKFGAHFFWKKYGEANAKVCRDFDLTPTKSIHLAMKRDGTAVGIRPLLRYLVEGSNG